MMVEELSQGSIAGLLKQQGRYLTNCWMRAREVTIELNDLSALSQLV